VLASRRSARLCRAAHTAGLSVRLLSLSLSLSLFSVPLFSPSRRSISPRSTSLYLVSLVDSSFSSFFSTIYFRRVRPNKPVGWRKTGGRDEEERARASARRMTIETFENSVLERRYPAAVSAATSYRLLAPAPPQPPFYQPPLPSLPSSAARE